MEPEQTPALVLRGDKHDFVPSGVHAGGKEPESEVCWQLVVGNTGSPHNPLARSVEVCGNNRNAVVHALSVDKTVEKLVDATIAVTFMGISPGTRALIADKVTKTLRQNRVLKDG